LLIFMNKQFAFFAFHSQVSLDRLFVFIISESYRVFCEYNKLLKAGVYH